MDEVIELRIPEKEASRFLTPDQGTRSGYGGWIRHLTLRVDDPLLARIKEIDARIRPSKKRVFASWNIKRRYSPAELEAAALLQLHITAVFEPAAEECGTEYDDTDACPVCGAGRIQRSPLRLPASRLPRHAGIAVTIAGDEWLISDRLVGLLREHGMTGWRAQPIAWTGPTPASGRGWHQLLVTSRSVVATPPTRFGTDPFHPDPDRYRCPFGHVSGINMLSELFLDHNSWDGSDVVRTADLVGIRRGLLVPAPRLLVSQRLGRRLRDQKMKGFEVEVAHLI